MIICKKCSHTNPDTAQICEKCGESLAVTQGSETEVKSSITTPADANPETPKPMEVDGYQRTLDLIHKELCSIRRWVTYFGIVSVIAAILALLFGCM